MGHGASRGALELEDDSQPGHRLHAILHGLWFRGYPPTNFDYGAPRVRVYDKQGAEASLEDAMDQLDEAHDVALLRSAKYQQALRRYHSHRV